MLPSADPTHQKYHCIFVCIILVFHSCHGSKIYTQQPHCHFRLQMELVCSQFGSAKKEICIYYMPGPMRGIMPRVLRGIRKGFLQDVTPLQSRLFLSPVMRLFSLNCSKIYVKFTILTIFKYTVQWH